VAANPHFREYQQFLCMNRLAFANSFASDSDYAAAVRAAEQLAETAGGSHAFPTEMVWAAAYMANSSTLASKDLALPESKRAELAKSYAEQAMEFLRTAIKLGYKDADKLKKWPGFASIYLRPDFKEIINELKKKEQAP